MRGFLSIVRRHHGRSHTAVYTPRPYYRRVEVRRIEDIDDPLKKDHWLIESEYLRNVARELAVYRGNKLDFVATIRNVYDWVRRGILYDNVHAEASRKWRKRFNVTYLTADECARLRRGICGEMALVMLKILRELGIPAVLVRPSVSHLAVLVKHPEKEEYWLLDPVTGHFGKVPKYEAVARYESPTGKYAVGIVSLDEFAEQTIKKRRRLAEKLGLSPEEAIDLEYAIQCMEDLPYQTDFGTKVLNYLKEVGYCARTFRSYVTEDVYLASSFFEEVAERCGKVPVERIAKFDIPEKYLMCVRRAWEEVYLQLYNEFKEELERLLGR